MVFFSLLVGKEIFDSEGRKVGKLRDFIVDFSKKEPEVTALIYSDRMNDKKKLPWEHVESLEKTGIFLNTKREELILPSIEKSDIMVGETILDKQVVDIDGLKVVRVNDIVLEKLGSTLHITNIDIGFKGILRRLGLVRINKLLLAKYPPNLVKWENLETLQPELKKLQLKVPQKKLSQLHPADIADLMEDLSHIERAIFFKSLDTEKAANTLEEAQPEVQKSVFKNLNIQRISKIIEHMHPDEAADLLPLFPEDKTNEILSLMSPEKAKVIKNISKYDINAAGGLMTMEFVSVSDSYTTDQAIELVRKTDIKKVENIHYIYVVDNENHLVGVISIIDLITNKAETKLSDIMRKNIVSVYANASKEEIGKLFAKYDLVTLPVTNQDNVLLGIITADDVIELISPKKWKETFYYRKKKKVKKTENKAKNKTGNRAEIKNGKRKSSS